MTRVPGRLTAIVAATLAVSAGGAICGQDKYTLQVPNGLAFSTRH